MSNLQVLRTHATATLSAPTTLAAAIDRLGFVQADPIRSPAAAQDLILRHRVHDYRCGDLDRNYAELGVEEDFFYAYGFVSRHLFGLLHPRKAGRLTRLESSVLAHVREAGAIHPRDLDAPFGRKRVVNGWGSHSRAAKAVLERLHECGLLRIARREKGIRIYAAATSGHEPVARRERSRALAMTVARLLAPVHEKSLGEVLSKVRRSIPALLASSQLVADLLRHGHLRKENIDGQPYLWPDTAPVAKNEPDAARFLAPFDPLVWDRRRFEHLWGWPYRFEAYLPAARRVRGYYALPLLWRTRVIGWANVSTPGGVIDVELGFVDGRPAEPAFDRAIQAEIANMAAFLQTSPEINRRRQDQAVIDQSARPENEIRLSEKSDAQTER